MIYRDCCSNIAPSSVSANHTRHASCRCSALTQSGMQTPAPCSSPLAGVCVTKHCPGRGAQAQQCCSLSEAEAAIWARRVQGRSLVLRPGQVHEADEVRDVEVIKSKLN